MTRRTVPTPLRRSFDRFMSNPGSVRNAAQVMIIATVVIVLIGGLIVWVFDSRDFPDYGSALWYALQTVTTVGYGDVTPVHVSGRIVAAIVMIWGTAYLAILTATITSTFVARAEFEYRRREAASEAASEEKLEVRLEDLDARLERIEQALARLASD